VRTPAYNLNNPQQQDDHAMIDTEGQYLDVLQNIEAAIVGVYREHPELLDYEVEKALNALAIAYQAEQQGRARQPAAVAPLPQQVYAAVHAVCEWRLGRETLHSANGSSDLRPEPLPLEVVIACLKHIRKSVQNWTRREGRQGYLRFVSDYV
jgi:hypothetical protein